MGVSEFTPNIQLSEFALKLRKYLFSQGLSFEALGKQVGVREERLRLFILDKAEPTRRELKRINKVIS